MKDGTFYGDLQIPGFEGVHGAAIRYHHTVDPRKELTQFHSAPLKADRKCPHITIYRKRKMKLHVMLLQMEV